MLLEWIKSGGKFIAIGSANKALAADDDFFITIKSSKESEEDLTKTLTPHALLERKQISQTITGSIFRVAVDETHPLGYGLDKYYTLKRSATPFSFLAKGQNVGLLTKQSSPLSGFAGHDALSKQAETLIFGTSDLGEGKIIYLIDNPLFRGHWHRGKKLFNNALFMVSNRP